MTLHVHALNPSNKADHAYIPAIARVHLAAWLTVPLMRAIYYGDDPDTHAAYIRANTQRHAKAFVEEFDPPSTDGGYELCRFAVVLDDSLPADDDCEEEEKEDVMIDEGTSQDAAPRPKGIVIAAIKYYLITPQSASPTTNPTTATPQPPPPSRGAEETSTSLPSATASRDWPPNSHALLASNFWSDLVQARTRFASLLGQHVLVDNLYTDPAHHRRGAGGMLMRHAAAEADARRWPSFLEASPGGIGVYESVGFRRVVVEGNDAEKHTEQRVEKQQHAEIWVDLRRWEGGGDKGVEFSERRLRENGGRRDDGWYCQIIMVRPASEKKA